MRLIGHIDRADDRLGWSRALFFFFKQKTAYEMKAFTLRGGVAVELDDMELETAEATYDRAKDLITSPGDVTIHGRTLDVRGRGMEIQVGPQHVRLLKNVHTTVHRNVQPS